MISGGPHGAARPAPRRSPRDGDRRAWQVANPSLADLVPVSQRYAIYRSAGAALTRRGREKTAATGSVSFLRSDDGARIFARWGWIAGPGARARPAARSRP